MHSLLALLATALSVGVCSTPARDDSLMNHPVLHHISLEAGYDYVSTSTGDVIREGVDANDRISTHAEMPVDLKYSFSFTDPRIRNYFPGGYQGIGVGVMNIGAAYSGGVRMASRYIGNPIRIYAFQGAPFWRINSRLNMNYEWNFGIAAGWKPYGESNKNFNLTVGSRVNAYLNLAVMLKWQIHPHIDILGGIGVTHFSNGNTSWPNPGVNAMGFRVGMQYSFKPAMKYVSPLPDTVVPRKLLYSISIWGAARKRVYLGGENPVLLKGHFACAGVSFSPLVRLNRWWRVGGALDLQWDESSDLKKNYVEGTDTEDIKFNRPAFIRQVTVGLSAHGELQMPIFAVNVGIGYNIVAPEENRGSYQNLTLKTYLTRNFYLNIGYQLRNFRQQANLMLGVGVTI